MINFYLPDKQFTNVVGAGLSSVAYNADRVRGTIEIATISPFKISLHKHMGLITMPKYECEIVRIDADEAHYLYYPQRTPLYYYTMRLLQEWDWRSDAKYPIDDTGFNFYRQWDKGTAPLTADFHTAGNMMLDPITQHIVYSDPAFEKNRNSFKVGVQW